MANKQQKLYRKLGLKTVNNGANTTVSKIEHGPDAFLTADSAIAKLKKSGCRCWKITKRHPATNKDKKQYR